MSLAGTISWEYLLKQNIKKTITSIIKLVCKHKNYLLFIFVNSYNGLNNVFYNMIFKIVYICKKGKVKLVL